MNPLLCTRARREKTDTLYDVQGCTGASTGTTPPHYSRRAASITDQPTQTKTASSPLPLPLPQRSNFDATPRGFSHIFLFSTVPPKNTPKNDLKHAPARRRPHPRPAPLPYLTLPACREPRSPLTGPDSRPAASFSSGKHPANPPQGCSGIDHAK